jgi:hypothetical protein
MVIMVFYYGASTCSFCRSLAKWKGHRKRGTFALRLWTEAACCWRHHIGQLNVSYGTRPLRADGSKVVCAADASIIRHTQSTFRVYLSIVLCWYSN